MFNAKLLNSFKFLRQAQSGTKEQKTQKDTSEAYRAGMKLAILGLSGLLLLTGCASSSSLEDQTKLLEYEKCLDFERELMLARSNRIGERVRSYIEEELKKQGKIFVDLNIRDCAKYRP